MLMMMLMNNETTRSNPTIQVPPWDNNLDDPTITSPLFSSPNATTSPNCSPFDALMALHRYLPSNNSDLDGDCELTSDAFSGDHFRMYEFKVRKCARGRSHDWTECPFAHPGEKARRRDPRRHHYSGAPCPDFRKGHCFRGDACEYAHGVFECWLHPARYRTMPCKDGAACRRRVCFFAHAPSQLRVVLPQATSPRLTESYDATPARLGFGSFDGSPSRVGYDGSPSRLGFDSFDGSPSRLGFGGSSNRLVSDSVECFPNRLAFDGSSSRLGFDSVDCGLGFDLVDNSASRLGYDSFFRSSPTSILYSPGGSPPSSGSAPVSPDGRVDSVSEFAASMRSMQIGGNCSPRGCVGHRGGSGLRPGFMSVPATPARSGLSVFEMCEEEEVERVESGRGLRARMYAKLSKENSVGAAACPDLGWVSELVK